MTDQSKLKWLVIGLLIALLNPVFSGLILGIAYLSEPRLKREGWIVLVFSLIWATIVFVFARRFLGR